MYSFLDIFKRISNVIDFMSLSKEKRHFTFYSEGANYWPHLEGAVRELLCENRVHVCYISSSPDDPGLTIENNNYHTFYVGNGFIRDWLFQNIKTNYMIMTMPDLHRYQVKRSRHPVHYIYVQHSLVSLHMIYRTGAFDYYDTICCAGQHHVQEVRAMEQRYNLPPKRIFKHGYSRLDSLIRTAQQYSSKKETIEGDKKHILIAPSWGPKGTIESGLAKSLIGELLTLGHFVILRPHPQTLKFTRFKVADVVKLYRHNSRFVFEESVIEQDGLHQSDIMISDWSGVALEYAFSLHKPVIFCDVPKKINNPCYTDIDLIPIEVSIRETIGVIWNGREKISNCLERCDAVRQNLTQKLTDRYVFNRGISDQKFVEFSSSCTRESVVLS